MGMGRLWAKTPDVTEAAVLHALRKQTWQTVPELAQRMRMPRIIYRMKIAKLLRAAEASGTVVARRRPRIGVGMGCGPTEYRKV